MTAVYHIGDLHLGHEKVAKIRGFATTIEHDVAIMDAWNKVVKPGDIVQVYGDISSGKLLEEDRALEIIESLPGEKRLLAGNHDSVSGIHRRSSPLQHKYYSVFTRITDFGRIRMENQEILQSHYPYISQGDGPDRGQGRYEQFRLGDYGGLLIHAHTHHTHPTDGSVTGRELCVSWDAWKRMVTTADISKWVRSLTIYKPLAAWTTIGYMSDRGISNEEN